MHEPFFSIVIPVLNGQNYLTEALASCLAQDFDDFEVVISDGGSTDETAAIGARFQSADRRVRIDSTASRVSQVGNTHRAMSLARGTWLKILCHDDLLEPNCLRVIHAAVADGGRVASLIGNGERHLFSNGAFSAELDETLGDVRPRHHGGLSYLRATLRTGAAEPLPALTTATVLRRSWEQFGGFRDGLTNFDTLGWAEFLLTNDYAFAPAQLTVTRIHHQQVTSVAQRDLAGAVQRQRFWSDFARTHAALLGISRWDRLRNRLRGPSGGATVIAIECLKGDYRNAVRMARSAPPLWWPLLPPLVARAWISESRRIRPLLERAPIEALYS